MAGRIFLANITSGHVCIWKKKNTLLLWRAGPFLYVAVIWLPRIIDIYEINVSSLSSNKGIGIYPEWVELQIMKMLHGLILLDSKRSSQLIVKSNVLARNECKTGWV